MSGNLHFFPKNEETGSEKFANDIWKEGQEIGSPVPKKRFVKELHKYIQRQQNTC